MGLESRESFAERFAGRCDAIEEFVSFEVIEDGVACGGGNGMGLIGEAVHEGGCALFECIDDAGSGKDCSERSEEHTSELQSRQYLVCRLLLEKKKKTKNERSYGAESG